MYDIGLPGHLVLCVQQDKAIELEAVGGTYGGNRKPTRFMCLVLKMLQIQPEKEIVIEYILNEDYKYGDRANV